MYIPCLLATLDTCIKTQILILFYLLLLLIIILTNELVVSRYVCLRERQKMKLLGRGTAKMAALLGQSPRM